MRDYCRSFGCEESAVAPRRAIQHFLEFLVSTFDGEQRASIFLCICVPRLGCEEERERVGVSCLCERAVYAMQSGCGVGFAWRFRRAVRMREGGCGRVRAVSLICVRGCGRVLFMCGLVTACVGMKISDGADLPPPHFISPSSGIYTFAVLLRSYRIAAQAPGGISASTGLYMLSGGAGESVESLPARGAGDFA